MKDYDNLKVEDMPKEYQDRIERFNNLFIQATGKPFTDDDLFGYELGCLQQSLAFVDHFKQKSDQELKELCDNNSMFEIIDQAEEDGCYIQDGHSGNSMGMSFGLFLCYRRTPQLLKYMHGCLAPLVWDDGYHDNRSDVPK